MAFTESTVGTLGSGADFAATIGALQLWENARQVITAEERAVLITDIQDDVTITGWPTAGTSIEIISNTVGVKRTIASPVGGISVLNFDDVEITSILLRDLILDGANTAVSFGLQLQRGCNTVTMDRIILQNHTFGGMRMREVSNCTTLNLDNCIIVDNITEGIQLLKTDVANTVTLRNCLITGNTTIGIIWVSNANVSVIQYNCLILNNTPDMPSIAGSLANITTDSCVSSDASASFATNGPTNVAINKTAFADYFVDFAGGDFHRAQNDTDAFGITSSVAATEPPEDYDLITRVDNTLGPFEFVLFDIGKLHQIRNLHHSFDFPLFSLS